MTLQRRNGLPYTTFTNILDFLTPPPHSEKCKYCFSATLLCFLTPSPPSVRTSHMEAPKWHFFEWPSVDVYPGVMALLAALGSPSCQKVSTTTVAGTIMSAGRGASGFTANANASTNASTGSMVSIFTLHCSSFHGVQ